MKKKLGFLVMTIALCSQIVTAQAQIEVLETSPSIGDTGNTGVGVLMENERGIALQGVERKSVQQPRGKVVWFAANVAANDWQENAMFALQNGFASYGSGPAAFTALQPGQLGEAWMVSFVSGHQYRLHPGYVFESPTPVTLASVLWVLKSSDPRNNFGFTGSLATNNVFGPNIWGIDTATGIVYKSGPDRPVNKIVFVGAGNAFTADVGLIQQFLDQNRPWSVRIEYIAGGTKVESTLFFHPPPSPPPPPPVAGKFIISPSTSVKPTGDVVPGTPLELAGSVWNSGNGSYIGVITNIWQYSANGGPWTPLASAGTLTNLVSGESKSVVTSKWDAGSPNAAITYRLRLLSLASDGDHASDETVRVIAPLPPISMRIAKVGTETSIVVSGPAGIYELRKTENVSLPWDRWSIVTTSPKSAADESLIKFGSTLGMGVFKVARVK